MPLIGLSEPYRQWLESAVTREVKPRGAAQS